MKLEHSLGIFDYLEKSGRVGKSVLTISREVKLTPNEVRACINGLSDSFVRVGDSEKFTVNNIKGATRDSLIEEHLKMVKESKSDTLLFWALIVISFAASVTTLLTNN